MSYLYPLFAILFWAGNVIVSKMAASAISPTAITFYRLVLALFLMGLFTARPAWRNRKLILRHWPKLALYGALSSALFQALSYRAAETTTATNMAILTALIPLLSMLLSVVILRDPLTLGMAVAVFVALPWWQFQLQHGHWRASYPELFERAWQNGLTLALADINDIVALDKVRSQLNAELEQQMQHVVNTYQCEWKTAVTDPAVRQRFRSFVNAPTTPDPGLAHVPERGQIRPARPEERGSDSVLIAGTTLEVRR